MMLGSTLNRWTARTTQLFLAPRRRARRQSAAAASISTLETRVLLAAAPQTIFHADFQDGAGNPSLDNFIIDNSLSNGLWKLSTGRSNTPGHTPPGTLYFGQNEGPNGGGNYSTGVRAAGHVTSPQIFVPRDAELTFNYLRATEANTNFDVPILQVSIGAGAFNNVAFNFVNDSSGFQQGTVNLNAFANQLIRLRFVFDTIDATANNFEGFYLDDIRVTGQATGSLVGIDFGGGANTTPTNWTLYNTTGDGSRNNLINEAGVGTGINFTLDVQDDGLSYDSATFAAGQLPGHPNSLTNLAGNFYDSSSTSMTWSNLKPGHQYFVYIFGGDVFSGAQEVSIDGANQVTFSQSYGGNQLAVNDELGTSARPLSSYGVLVTATTAGVITANVGAGGFTYGLAGVAIQEAGAFEVNDSIPQATPTGVVDGSTTFSAFLGDNPFGNADMDFYHFFAVAGATLRAETFARSLDPMSPIDTLLVLYDSQGNQIADNDDGGFSVDSLLQFDLATAGDYYLMVQRFGANSPSNPFVPNTSGSALGTIGRYNLQIEVNQKPVIATPGGDVTYLAGASPTRITASGEILDAEDDFANGVLTVQLTNGGASDRLSFISENGVTVSGSNVLVDGVVVGTFTGGESTTAFVVTLNSNANSAFIARRILRQVGFSNTTSAPSLFDRNVTIQFTDGDGLSSDVTNKVLRVSNQPVVRTLGNTLTYFAGLPPQRVAAPATIFDGGNNFPNGVLSAQLTNGGPHDRLTIIPGQQITVAGNAVLLNGVAIGTFSGGVGSNPLVITFNASANFIGTQMTLQQIAYSSVAQTPSAGARTYRVIYTDGTGSASAPVQKQIEISGRPTITGFTGGVTYNAGPAPAPLVPNAVLFDGGGNFGNGIIRARTTNGGPNDRLSIAQGNGVTVAGNQFFVNGVLFGTIAGGAGTNELVLTFTPGATLDATQRVLRQVGFSNLAATPATGNRSVEITYTDGAGNVSPTIPKTVTISSQPTIATFGGTVTYQAGPNPVRVTTTATLFDGGGNFANGVLRAQLTNGGPNDRLTIAAGNGVTLNGTNVLVNGVGVGSFTTGAGTTALVMTFNGAATLAQTEAVMRQIGFFNLTQTPATNDRTVVMNFTDGLGNISPNVSKAITIGSQPGIFDLGPVANYTPGGAAVRITTTATISDGGGNFANGQLRLQVTNGGPNDRLTLIAGAGVTLAGSTVRFNGVDVGTFAGGVGTGVLQINFNGAATLDSVQAVLRQAAFSNVAPAPAAGARVISLQFIDGLGNASAIVNKNVTVS